MCVSPPCPYFAYPLPVLQAPEGAPADPGGHAAAQADYIAWPHPKHLCSQPAEVVLQGPPAPGG